MLHLDIPGYGNLSIEHIVLDYNGTLAQDGKILPGIPELFEQLAKIVTLHVVTGDTFGHAAEQLAGLACQLKVLPAEHQAEAKLDYARELGLQNTICMGNGRNDRLMVRYACLGIGIIQAEGAASELIQAADLCCDSIADALALFTHPKRLIATLRA